MEDIKIPALKAYIQVVVFLAPYQGSCKIENNLNMLKQIENMRMKTWMSGYSINTFYITFNTRNVRNIFYIKNVRLTIAFESHWPYVRGVQSYAKIILKKHSALHPVRSVVGLLPFPTPIHTELSFFSSDLVLTLSPSLSYRFFTLENLNYHTNTGQSCRIYSNYVGIFRFEFLRQTKMIKVDFFLVFGKYSVLLIFLFLFHMKCAKTILNYVFRAN